jgi:anti-sigma factor RsiW
VSGRVRHLDDDRLFDCYVSARIGEHPDPSALEHLGDCDDCERRYAELSTFMESLATEATAEADDHFTPERLRIQRQRIAEKIAQAGRAARVISFPGREASAGHDPQPSRVASRWVAAAAVAGIIIGLGAGVFLESESRTPRAHTQSAALRPAKLSAPSTPFVPGSEAADDRFMSELELALDRPRTRELAPFDALTPHVREVANRR